MLAKHEAAFEADLAHQYPGTRLADFYRGEVTARELSVYLTYLPRGANVWQAVGGGMAITAEVEALWLLEHTTLLIAHANGGGKGKKPDMRKYPLGIEEAEKKANYSSSQAEAFRRRQAEKAARERKAAEPR